MKVKMTTERRDDQWYEDGAWRSYPAAGEVLETNSVHAADLCAHGYAKPVKDTDGDVETREAKDDDTRPAVNDPKADWVAHAAARGAVTADAEAMTKQQLIDNYGG